jgi:CRP-like cAMP-binding protein
LLVPKFYFPRYQVPFGNEEFTLLLVEPRADKPLESLTFYQENSTPMQLTVIQKNILQKTALFTDLPDASFQKITDQSMVVELLSGDKLFEQGQAINSFFFLLSGQVKLTRLSFEGNEKVIEIINSGDSFAEAAVFGKFSGYPVNCFALQNSVVVQINAKSYMEELSASIDSCFAVLTKISQRTHHLLSEIDRLTLHNATHRLAVYLLLDVKEKKGSATVKLVAPKHIIASRLSVKPETLSRTFKRLIEQGFITMNEKHIVINDITSFRGSFMLG